MSATSQIHVTLHYYCSLHTDSTLLYIQVKQQQQPITFNYNVTAINVPTSNMLFKYYTYAS